jgi:predicted RNase H-like HicB family nuclease
MISKYRGDYESALINLDDTIDVLMLKTALNFNQKNPSDTFENLSKMHQAKIALNSVMKFVDSQ